MGTLKTACLFILICTFGLLGIAEANAGEPSTEFWPANFNNGNKMNFETPVRGDSVIVGQLKELSQNKWQWMADKDVDKLAGLFHEGSKFVHMSGTWNKDRELEIIETGSIWYKEAIVHDVAVELFGKSAILWNRITLKAVVRGQEVSNEFTVTEVYQEEPSGWKLLALTFSSVRDTHELEH